MRAPRVSVVRRALGTGTSRVWLLNAAAAAAGVAFFATLIRAMPAPDAPVRIQWWVLAAIFGASELFVVHLQFRREAYTFSMNEIPLVLGLFFTSPRGIVLAQLIGAAPALILHRRQQPIKVAFNLAQLSITTSIAATLFHHLRPTDAIGPAGWGNVYLASIVAGTAGYLLIGMAISLSEGKLVLKNITSGMGLGLGISMGNTSLGLIGVTTIWIRPESAWLLVPPVAILFLAYRAYTAQRREHASLELLYESGRMLQHSLKVDQTIEALLTQARTMFRAEMARITMLPVAEGEPASEMTLGPGDRIEHGAPQVLDPTEGVWARVASEGRAVLLGRPITNERLRAYFAAKGIRDAMVAPVYGKTGRVIGTLVVANRLGDVATFEVDDLKLFETLANHASSSLQNARLVAQLEESLAHLTRLNRLKDDFVATVSHELRTPLTCIQGYVKTMLRPDVEVTPNEQRDFLQVVERHSDRLRLMIEDLLEVGRIESETMFPAILEVSVPALVQQLVHDLLPSARGHGLQLHMEGDIRPVPTDGEFVRRILTNLVENALKYSPAGTIVTIGGQARTDGVVVWVQDQGPGIPQELQEQIFGRFFQADQSSTRRVGGIGLGLYICKRLADALGGRVWLDKSGPEGSKFCLLVPWSAPAAAREPGEPVTHATA